MSTVISESINQAGTNVSQLQRVLDQYNSTDYELGTLQVRRVLDSDEVTLRVNRPKFKVIGAVPKEGSTFNFSYTPKVLILYLSEDVAQNTIGSGVLKVNNVVQSYTASLSGTRVILIEHNYSVVSPGHFVFTLSNGITSMSGNVIEPFSWDMYITRELLTTSPGEPSFPYKYPGQLLIKRISIGRYDSVTSILQTFLRSPNIKILDIAHQEHSSEGPKTGNLYILYTYDNTLNVEAISPSRGAVVSRTDTTIAVTFSKTIYNSADFSSRITVTNAGAQSTFLPGSGGTWLNDGKTFAFDIPADHREPGLHFTKIDLRNLIARDGEVIKGYPYVYSNWYYANPLLRHLADVQDYAPADTNVLTWNAASSSWIPGTGGSGSGPGTGHFLMVHNDATVANGRAITFNEEFIVTDGGAGGQYQVRIRESQIPHNSLAGLASGDPHTQYSLVDGTRDFLAPVAGVDPADAKHFVTKNYFETGTVPGGEGLTHPQVMTRVSMGF